MILADKIILLRKKAGWSQEELAEQMNVTRQSISKWEGAQSIPDLEKIIRLSGVFGVSTDYLLKDEIEDTECKISPDEITSVKRVSMEEANAFLSAKAETSKSIALATFLCIIYPICLIILGAVSEFPKYNLSSNAASGIGTIVMVLIIAAAVAIFISSGAKTAPYEYLEKEIFETEYGVTGMVTERKNGYRKTYTRNNIIGTYLCITAVIPLFIGTMFNNNENELFMTIMLSFLFILVGVGVFFFISGGIVWASYEKLLQEGDYSRKKKKNHTIISTYWSIVTAIYLGYSFLTNNWHISWVIWPVAGVLSPIVNIIADKITGQK